MLFTSKITAFFLSASLLTGQVANTDPRPVEYISRAEVVMALILARTPDFPAIRNTGRFPDVPKGMWYEPTMLLAERYGIIAADPATNMLRPTESVTRADFLKMLTLTFGLPVNYPHRYGDVPTGSWFDHYAGLAQHYRLFPGESTRLEPQRIITRDEAMKAFRLFERLREREQDLRLEQDMAGDQAANKLKLYTVISTRRMRVTFIEDGKQEQPRKITKPVKLPPSLPEMRTVILQTVNDIRVKNGLEPLTYNSRLEQSAQAFGERMAAEGFFAHVTPDGQTLKDRIRETGYYNRDFSNDCYCVKGYALGENLARGQKTAEEAVKAWMKSPSHRDAILNPDYRELGIGVAAGIWVQHFGGVLLPGETVHSAAD